MLAVKGIYQNGQIKLTEFLDDNEKIRFTGNARGVI